MGLTRPISPDTHEHTKNHMKQVSSWLYDPTQIDNPNQPGLTLSLLVCCECMDDAGTSAV